MNIRKKILYNPSHLKSVKPDSSDNTTANTKNSAILDQSKTFKLTTNYTFSTQRSKNYLRTLSKQIKKQNSAYTRDVATSIVKKNHVMPSFSTLSNQNLPPLKKGIINRKFLLESEQLPPLASGKRPTMLSSQNERKLPIFPSSQINSNKDVYNPNSLSRKQYHGHGKIPINRILGNEVEEIQRRKQQLNSLNPGSFYTTQKSIGLSKFSIGSRQSSRNQNSSKNSDRLSIQRQKKPSQFVPKKQSQQKIQNLQQTQFAPQQSNAEESVEESIVQEIERNKSLHKQKRNVLKKEQQINNDWNQTLKSSMCESKTVEVKMPENKERSVTESSLCESEEIDEHQVEEKKKTCRLIGSSQKKSSQKKYSFNKDQDFCLQTLKSQQQSSLCESYQMQTPPKHSK